MYYSGTDSDSQTTCVLFDAPLNVGAVTGKLTEAAGTIALAALGPADVQVLEQLKTLPTGYKRAEKLPQACSLHAGAMSWLPLRCRCVCACWACHRLIYSQVRYSSSLSLCSVLLLIQWRPGSHFHTAGIDIARVLLLDRRAGPALFHALGYSLVDLLLACQSTLDSR